MQRRKFLGHAGALMFLPPRLLMAGAPQIPSEVAGIRLPRTPRALSACAYARAHCPPFLFNHCMRTYLFGALILRRQGRAFAAEEAFIASALHDLGLLPPFESRQASFETDGADAAERWALRQGASAAAAARIWHAVQIHDGAWALTRRQGGEAMLVALGAGTDVDGPQPQELSDADIVAVLEAFPRLQFKRQFTALLIGHCQRKPDSQAATWLDALCGVHAHGGRRPQAVEEAIAAAPFGE
jgi:HD domain